MQRRRARRLLPTSPALALTWATSSNTSRWSLQTLAGSEVGFGKARETSEEGVYKVIVEYIDERWAASVWPSPANSAWRPFTTGPSHAAEHLTRLRDIAQRGLSGPEHPGHCGRPLRPRTFPTAG